MSVLGFRLAPGRVFPLAAALRNHAAGLPCQTIMVAGAPTELSVLGIIPELVYAKSAWPHVDTCWAGKRFFMLTVEGLSFEFGSLSIPDGVAVPVGSIFKATPGELHWLRPDPKMSAFWLALQWVVPLEEEGAFEQALAEAISRWSLPDFSLPLLDGSTR